MLKQPPTIRFLRRKNERCALATMGKQRIALAKSPPQARLLPATWRLLPATAATKRLDFCGKGSRLYGIGLTAPPPATDPAVAERKHSHSATNHTVNSSACTACYKLQPLPPSHCIHKRLLSSSNATLTAAHWGCHTTGFASTGLQQWPCPRRRRSRPLPAPRCAAMYSTVPRPSTQQSCRRRRRRVGSAAR